MNETLREYYLRAFPTDELGKDLNQSPTFTDLFITLDQRKDVYICFGIGDSIVRERLFSRLAFLLGVEYDYVYEQWLLCA